MRVTTWPAWRIRYSSRRNSRGCRVISWPARLTACDSRSSSRSPTAVDGLDLLGAGAAVQHLDAGQQLGEGVGLGQIVVAAGAQAGDPVVDLAERGQDQHRRRVAARPQAGDQRQPVAARQHAVDDQHVVVDWLGKREAGFAVGGEVGSVAGLGQRLLQVIGGLAVVLDDRIFMAALSEW